MTAVPSGPRRDTWLAIGGVGAAVALWSLVAWIADSPTIVPGPYRTFAASVTLLRDG